MMSNTKSIAVTLPIGWLSSALFLIFLTLKLCGVIGWSWWWVTAPLWIPFALMSAILIGAGVYTACWLIVRLAKAKAKHIRRERL